jgi:tetratricopeptide (TPR) repeat protein
MMDQLLRQLPGSADELLAVTRSMEARGQAEEAIELLKAAERVSPDARFERMLGTLLMKQGRHKEALVPLVAVLKQQPQHHPTMLMVCESLIECGEYERASGMLQQAERAGAPSPHIQNLRQLVQRRRREQQQGGVRRDLLDDPSASMLKSSPLERMATQDRLSAPDAGWATPEDQTAELRIADAAMAALLKHKDPEQEERTGVLPHDMLSALRSGAVQPTLPRPGAQGWQAAARQGPYAQEETGQATSALGRAELERLHAALQDQTTEQAVPDILRDPSDSDLMTSLLPTDEATSLLPTDAIPFDAMPGRQAAAPSHQPAPQPVRPAGFPVGRLPPQATARPQAAAPQPMLQPPAARQPTPMASPAQRRPPNDMSLESDIQIYRPPKASLFESQVGTDEELPLPAAPPSPPPQGHQQASAPQAPLLGRPNALSGHGVEDQYSPDMSGGFHARDELFGRVEDLFAVTGPDLSRSGPQQGWGRPAQPPHTPSQQGGWAPQAPAVPQGYHAPSGPPPRPPQAPQSPDQPRALSELSDKIELAIDLPTRNAQGTADRPAEPPAAKTAGKPSAAMAARIAQVRSRQSGKGRSAAMVGALIGLGGVLALYLIVFIADRGLRKEVQGYLSAATQLQAADTFASDIEALSRLDAAQATTSILGEAVDGLVQSRLPALPGLSAQRMRKQTLVEAAVIAARLEDRYAAPGAYQAEERVKRALEAAGEGHAQVMGARAQVLRQKNLLEALGAAQLAMMTQPNSSYVREVLAELLLELHQVEAAGRVVAPLREMKLPQARQHYLIARIAVAQSDKQAPLLLRKLLDGLSQQHMDARVALAETMVWSAEDHPRAASLLAEVIEAKEDSVPPCQKARAYAVRARLEYRQEQRDKASATARKAAALCPERPEATLALVDLLLDMGELEEARAVMDRQQAGPRMAHELQLRRARLAQLTSRTKEGIEALAGAPQEDPRVHWLRGHLYLDMGDLERAQRAFDAGAERDAMLGAMQAWSRIARAMRGESPDAAALEAIDRIAGKAEHSAMVQRAAGVMRLLMAEQERDASKRQDMLSQAKKRLDSAARLMPDDALIQYDLCRVQLMRRQRGADRQSPCMEGKRLGRRYIPGILLVAQLHQLQGAWPQAEELLKELQQHAPDDHRIGAALVRTYLVAGRTEAAQQTLDAWIKDPIAKTAGYKLLQGLVAFNMRDFATAQGYLQQAVELAPKDAEAQIFLAYAKLRQGDMSAAVEDALKAQLRHPRWGGFAWLALGELRRRQGRFQDAEENLAQAIAILQESATPPWMLGEAYLQRALAWQAKHGWGHKQVKQYLDDAAGQGDVDSAELAYVRGLYLLNQKKPLLDEAAAELERSLAAAPRSCDTLQALALTYKRLKRGADLERVAQAQTSLKCAP